MSDRTTAGSANSPPALLGFRALIFLDMDSSEIEMEEIVFLSVGSFPVSTSGQTVFTERLVPTVAKTVFIRFAFSLLRTARVLSSRLIGPIWGLLFGFVASESTFKYAAVDFAESVFSRKKLSFAQVLNCYFISDLFVSSPGCYVLGAHGGLKEIVPIIHLSSYFVSYPWVALATDFYLFKRYVFITYFIEHQVPRALHIVFIQLFIFE